MAHGFCSPSIEKQDTLPQANRQATLIGILASRDDRQANLTLSALLECLYNQPDADKKMDKFHLVFTGGTHDRIFYGDDKLRIPPLNAKVADWYRNHCGITRLPPTEQGGVTALSYLVTQKQCSLVWPFFAPMENHWLRPENLALMRLCDQWHVKRLMNRGSVLVWFDREALVDGDRNLQPCPPWLTLFPDDKKQIRHCSFKHEPGTPKTVPDVPLPSWKASRKNFGDLTIALIAHNEMKDKMIDFAIDHEAELKKFRRIMATGTTGREVAAATSKAIDEKMIRAHSGPKGGDIEIATAVLCDECHIVIFFIDPLTPHPHVEDIRVVFEACMVKDQVVMITNQMHAREFMARVVRATDQLTLYPLNP